MLKLGLRSAEEVRKITVLCFHCMTSKVRFGFLGSRKPKYSNKIREFSL